ncbi:MAG: Sec-independent protein translocase protein TatB, partial [Sulfurimonas sp.]|nr:Sec-independent protein translocase protein TatB [Sulfurimonas sp.]
MFGMGFTEILIIAVIAILFLGPDKLPGAMVDIAKFFKSAKDAIGSVKDSLEEELNVSDIKKEALEYKAKLDSASSKLSEITDVKTQVGSQISSILDDEEEVSKA